MKADNSRFDKKDLKEANEIRITVRDSLMVSDV